MLHVTLEEEPCLLPLQRLRHRVRVPHYRNPNFPIGDPADEGFNAEKLSVLADEWCGPVVGRDTRDDVPVSSCCDVFVFVTTDVGIGDAICKVEPQGLLCRDINYIKTMAKMKAYILRVRTFGVTCPRRPHLEGRNIVVTTVDLRSRDSSKTAWRDMRRRRAI